jgi:hypothetical protein
MTSSLSMSRPAPDVTDRIDAAARRVYDAELALHAARQSGIDQWVAAASERLHAALSSYLNYLGQEG